MDTAGHVAFLDRYYATQRRLYNFTRRFFLFGREALLRRVQRDAPASVLEMGCGTGRNLARMARHLLQTHFTGLDASTSMLAATPALPRTSWVLACAETIADADALGRPQGFDAVIFSYSLSMMPDWRAALEAARRCLRSGGTLHVVDFWDFAAWPGLVSRGLVRRLAAHRVRFEPECHDWLRAAGDCEITPVMGRWAYIACVRSP